MIVRWTAGIEEPCHLALNQSKVKKRDSIQLGTKSFSKKFSSSAQDDFKTDLSIVKGNSKKGR